MILQWFSDSLLVTRESTDPKLSLPYISLLRAIQKQLGRYWLIRRMSFDCNEITKDEIYIRSRELPYSAIVPSHTLSCILDYNQFRPVVFNLIKDIL